jgi:uncharacterized protein YprB with RNaseH-like and TPR domain
MISAQWGWNDKKRVNTISLLDDIKSYDKHFSKPLRDLPKNPSFDRVIVEKIHSVLLEADVIVHHNGDRFDLKKVNAKFIEYGLDPVPVNKTVDTLKEIKKIASFTSHALGALCEKLDCLHQKRDNQKGDFFKVSTGDVEAIKRIVKYGIGDIPTLKELYYKLRPYMKTHPNINLYQDSEYCCPACGHTKIKIHTSNYVTNKCVKIRYQCKSCRHTFVGDKVIKRSKI